MAQTYDYARPALTVDILLFSKESDQTQILLIKRKNEPFAGKWAFPGGFVDSGETVELAAHRELLEETSIDCKLLKQFKVFSKPGRDPRGWTVSVAFYAFIPLMKKAIAQDDASDAKWFSLGELPPLAFDHSEIIEMACKEILT